MAERTEGVDTEFYAKVYDAVDQLIVQVCEGPLAQARDVLRQMKANLDETAPYGVVATDKDLLALAIASSTLKAVGTQLTLINKEVGDRLLEGAKALNHILAAKVELGNTDGQVPS